jgi:hypothetical protein
VRARFTAIYRLHGANTLPEEAESADLAALLNPTLTATLTTDPEADFLHVDRFAALGAQLLKGLFAPNKESSLHDRLAAEIEDVKARRARKTRTGIFLVLDGETDIPAPEFRARRDTDEWAVALDAIGKP